MDHLLAPDATVDFDDMANQLLAEGAEQSPAYVHGGLCGVFAAAGRISPEDALAGASQALELGLHGELAETSLQLAALSLSALQDEEFDFHLFLPGEEAELELQVRALADWCRGFLASFALMVADTGGSGLDDETGEILRDIAAIGDAAVDGEADSEESEGHLFEITEYLRFACLNLFMGAVMEQEASSDAGEEP